ncbi:arsenical pump-driving ATPase [Nitratidesulfovibrio sp. SRB-5]|uniref:arsenical pump-driving ATPase n=1 Tax=Nitratidesulfovibrio sp. SRB-5 TaxID=2872636 RepID=UPI002958D2E3|nr:arsenical pump-driving ATPase [Nitratidesulfovibrio sp. SRB-5]
MKGIIMFAPFDLGSIPLTKYLFFTGKGGVGKTSVACAVAVTLADQGKRILLISTDPASNLQDVFDTELDGHGVPIRGVDGLVVANLDPEEAAREYRESVVAPYRGKLPDSAIASMEEQLSGSCTLEIAAFDQFTTFLTNDAINREYDHIIFDTAPTGHTLRMLQLPSAWSSFISESTHGASCLGQLAGLEGKQQMYRHAVGALGDAAATTLVLVSRPDAAPLKEADRSSAELRELGIRNQILIINAVLENPTDAVSGKLHAKQQAALRDMPQQLAKIRTYAIPLVPYTILGLDAVRAFLSGTRPEQPAAMEHPERTRTLGDLVADLHATGKKVIFTMGKGGVGKTTIAASIALGLARKGAKVHLTSTDPASDLQTILKNPANITLSRIDEKEELDRYRKEVLDTAMQVMSKDDVAYIEEDLRSPCTQEIAVFRAFAEIVEKAGEEIVIIDTAPTGHTLLLLDATQSHHKEVQRTKGIIPPSVRNLLPRLRDPRQTEVVIVTLPEATPVFEAERLQADLRRAGIHTQWWVVNQCFSLLETDSPILRHRAAAEAGWINRVNALSAGHTATIPWMHDTPVTRLLDTL